MTDSEKLRDELQTIAKFASVLTMLGWDEEVNLPEKGHAYRGEVSALLAAQVHKRVTAPEFIELSRKLAPDKSLGPDDNVVARETWRDVSRAQKLSVKFVEDLTKIASEAFGVWVEARKKSDFKLFQPVLERIVDMKRQQAELIGYSVSPYDALLDEFEPGMTSVELDKLFKPLAAKLAALTGQIKDNPLPKLPEVSYPLAGQEKLCREISAALGYDLKAGRIDISPHPFSVNFHPTDVRITTRYDENDFWVSLGSTIHEVGHALYEQGLPVKDFGTPLGEAVSLGIHESQSRMWENLVGRSREFSQYLHPLLIKYFPDQKISYSAEELYRWLNRVKPSLIRVEADEVTYNLHIILRHEIEKDLIEGKLQVADLPAVWNQKIKDYLGLDVPNDALGVLQDVHWSHGAFGYFPTYSLGNLYSAQLFDSAKKALPTLGEDFKKGEFGGLLMWLRENIHGQGRRYNPAELIKKITGAPLNPDYLQRHLQGKIELAIN